MREYGGYPLNNVNIWENRVSIGENSVNIREVMVSIWENMVNIRETGWIYEITW